MVNHYSFFMTQYMYITRHITINMPFDTGFQSVRGRLPEKGITTIMDCKQPNKSSSAPVGERERERERERDRDRQTDRQREGERERERDRKRERESPFVSRRGWSSREREIYSNDRRERK